MKVHFGVNDRFFGNFIDAVAELGFDDHKFIVYGKSDFSFEKKVDERFVKFVDDLRIFNSEIDLMVHRSTLIYIHYLSEEVIDYFNGRKIRNKKIVWVFWGNDGYPLVEDKIKDIPNANPLTSLRKKRGNYIRIRRDGARRKIEFLKNVDFFAHYIHRDFLLFKPLMKPSTEFIFFCYGVAEKMVRDIKLTGEDMLIGNSADVTNNHIYVMRNILSSSLCSDFVFPISYAGDPEYIKKLIITGEKQFASKFKPLVHLLDLDTYSKIVANCAYSIMYHTRPQGWGVIMQLLWQGSRVFMFKENNLYKFLMENGFVVNEINRRMDVTDKFLLSNEQKIKNRAILDDLFSKQKMFYHYRHLLSL